jgi:hypothetical protein
VRVTIEKPPRTRFAVSEFTCLPADAVMLIGAGPWLHIPVGKLREDRYRAPPGITRATPAAAPMSQA